MQSVAGARGAASAAAGWLDRVAASAWFAYGSIFLIQAKLLWGIWRYRDLTSGDTTSYFIDASRWAHSLHLDVLWSPLYTAFWGSLQWIVPDPYASTIVHRVLIAMAATLLVLAVLRRLLSPGIAWVLAVWWAILPINYDLLYEVHLFALLPELAAALIALTWSGLRMRATVFALILVSAFLVRNEAVFALAIWTLAWIAYEWRARRRGEGAASRQLAVAFGVPILALAAVIGLGSVSYSQGDLLQRWDAKEGPNVCEDYAFGYEQRHHDYKGAPFAGCGPLMERDFGQPYPTWVEAIRANPSAVGEHFLWNTRLIPYGLQLMLFDRISAGGQNRDPDYVPVKANSTGALVGSIALAGFVLAGLALLWRDWRGWWEASILPRAWGWLALGSLGATGVVVMVWQRPRPEYLFALTVFILAVVGICAMAFVDRWQVLKRVRAAIPLAALVLLVLLPFHFSSGYATPQIDKPGRPLKAMVDRLHPMRDQLRGNRVRLLGTYAGPGCAYIGGYDPCKPVSWKPILRPPPGVTASQALAVRGVDFIYLDEGDLQLPWMRDVVRQATAAGWTRAAPSSPDHGWLLLGTPARASNH